MGLIIILYLGIGLLVQWGAYSVNPDWADADTYRHILLWPTALFDPVVLYNPLAGLHWVYLLPIALILLPLCGVLVTARLSRRARIRKAGWAEPPQHAAGSFTEQEEQPPEPRLEPQLAG